MEKLGYLDSKMKLVYFGKKAQNQIEISFIRPSPSTDVLGIDWYQ